MVDLNETRLVEVENEVPAADRHRFSYITANLASVFDVEQVFERAGTLGCCTTLVNAARIGLSKSLDDHGESDWDRGIGVNLKGSFWRLHAAAGQMRSAGDDVIVSIASVVGFIPSPMPNITYDVGNGAVVRLTRSAAL